MKRQRMQQLVPALAGPAPVIIRTLGRRPVDKALIYVSKNDVVSAQQTTVLATATFPCTVVGLRWDLSFETDGGTDFPDYAWAIAVTREGESVNTLSVTDGATVYSPEQNVMVYGAGNLGKITEGSSRHYVGDTKTMRKLMGGDVLIFAVKGVATHSFKCTGAIQFFCKT